jgi:hypothetical protein
MRSAVVSVPRAELLAGAAACLLIVLLITILPL